MREVGTTGNLIDPRGVNHAKHYNSHPSGVEVQEIIRRMGWNCATATKYVLRRGLKCDVNLTALQTAIKDLDKTLWYLKDELAVGQPLPQLHWDGYTDSQMAKVISHEPDADVRTFLHAMRMYAMYGIKANLEAAMRAVSRLKQGLEEQQGLQLTNV